MAEDIKLTQDEAPESRNSVSYTHLWLMELWEMKSDYPAKLLLSAAKKTTTAWCADAVRMCQVLDRRMKSEKGVDAVGELKLLLVRLGAQRR